MRSTHRTITTVLPASLALTLALGCTAQETETAETAAYLVAEQEDVLEGATAAMGSGAVDELVEERATRRHGRKARGVCWAIKHMAPRPDGPTNEEAWNGSRPDAEGRGRVHKKWGHAVKRLRWAFDEDGDGQLDGAERGAMVDAMRSVCEARKAAKLAEFDADGDGTLSREEKQAAWAASEQRRADRRAGRIAEHDTDGDGELSSGERQAMRAERRAHFEAQLAAADTDGDGTVSDEERAAFRAALLERLSQRNRT